MMPVTPTTFAGLVDLFLRLIGLAVPVLFAVLFLFIVWKIIDAWVLNAGDEKKQEEGRTLAVTAVIVFVVMVAAWGVVYLVRRTLFGL